MLNTILKVMAILILLPVLAMCTAMSLEIGEGIHKGYNEAKEKSETNIEQSSSDF